MNRKPHRSYIIVLCATVFWLLNLGDRAVGNSSAAKTSFDLAEVKVVLSDALSAHNGYYTTSHRKFGLFVLDGSGGSDPNNSLNVLTRTPLAILGNVLGFEYTSERPFDVPGYKASNIVVFNTINASDLDALEKKLPGSTAAIQSEAEKLKPEMCAYIPYLDESSTDDIKTNFIFVGAKLENKHVCALGGFLSAFGLKTSFERVEGLSGRDLIYKLIATQIITSCAEYHAEQRRQCVENALK